MYVNIAGVDLELLCEKAVFWPKKRTLLIADLHIGKVTHFRNNNIPVPQKAADRNFEVLENLIHKYKPKSIIFLGDLFHSYYNTEWDKLTFLLAKYSKVSVELITGNHDILKAENYTTAGIKCSPEKIIGPFRLTHHPDPTEKYYNLCGHIHPGVRMKGSGRQYVKLPCFYFGERQGILPAFGNFTGTAAVKINVGDQVYAVFNDQLMRVST